MIGSPNAISSRVLFKLPTWIILGFITVALRGAAPAWLIADAAQPTPTVFSAAPIVVLRYDVTLKYEPNGEVVENRKYAVRLAKNVDRTAATALLPYIAKSDTSFKFDAWIVRDGKTATTFKRDRWLDVASFDDNTLYTDYRQKVLVAASDCALGDVFGYEVQLRHRQHLLTDNVVFPDSFPLVVGELSLIVPPGATPTVAKLKELDLVPDISADRSVWHWRITNLPARKEEPWSASVAPRIISFNLPTSSFRTQTKRPDLTSWKAEAAWLKTLQAPAAKPTPEVIAQAKKLTENLTDQNERVRALAEYVQHLRYAVYYGNCGIGFGVQPNSASSVLKSQCGDCKDKSTLLCSMLEAIGVRAYMVIVNATTPELIEPGWPNLAQFNHAIVAFETPAGKSTASMVSDDTFGQLSFFDPTDEYTPFGWLPFTLQGTFGLIVDDRTQALVRLPAASLGEWSTAENISASIADDGKFSGLAKVRWEGAAAAEVRQMNNHETEKESVEYWNTALSRTVSGVSVSKLHREDRPKENVYEAEIAFQAAQFGQMVRDDFLIIRPDLLPSRALPRFSEIKRTRDVRVRSIHHHSAVSLGLPPALKISELPRDLRVESPYGTYVRSCKNENGSVVLDVSLNLPNKIVPVAEYAALRAFIGQIHSASQQTILLKIQPKT